MYPWENVCPLSSKPEALSSCQLWKSSEIYLVFGGDHHLRLNSVLSTDHALDMLPCGLPSWTLFGTHAQVRSQKLLFPNPTCFPSSAYFKLCNSWIILVTARYRPAPQPRQTCQLPSPCLGGICLTIPLAQHGMAIILAQSYLTVIRGVKTK